MGTYYSIKVIGQNINEEKLKKDIDELLINFNLRFSTYIDESELSKLNQMEANTQAKLSKEMFDLIKLSQEISVKSEGAFDVTVGPLVNAWGFGPDGKRNIPTDEKIKSLKDYVGMNMFSLEGDKLSKKNKNVYIDLSAIAKGQGVDDVAMFLMHKGFKNGLVEIGGEVRALGTKPDKTLWKVGIEKPSEKLGEGIQAVVELNNQAMATSGSYRNYVKYKDKVFSHTIDPRTSYPVEHTLISVTVISDTCAKADGWATALMVLGPKKGLEVVEKFDIPAYFLVKTQDSFEVISSSKMKNIIK